MDSSQKTLFEPEVAKALLKRGEARKAKSEKMQAITKGTQKRKTTILPPEKVTSKERREGIAKDKISFTTSYQAEAETVSHNIFDEEHENFDPATVEA